ncbi:16S rRNA (guanine(966)-N(2))-methyltransferase RsmD [Hydrogenispora ethanolica]|jgi:16S rRNA (guanine(966)-N(2))-methyltransferase RsmD|uniref:16S rRNA (Guanine(966)-N(2))-methyltransferase RsmD n=1 Tax=Hydrogenispora ethanolica TaxID=1082276 RepID=A0A4R1RS95_HYDET|nr:16S rRNA (guanine(966)-N(2))-methyltransferase RsmD [Hydrogenispora ethanolica]TCL69348.1 16S rRNA (guanine(966)-N(2))-methyltransferase RsmD [Hydrogenispora ethanolica]
MRVIAGKYRGRAINGPKHKGVRPTADRVKEALFNIIGIKIMDAAFLDLFAGTGAIGIEAFSRGATAVTMVDENLSSIRLIQENCKILLTEDRPRILHLPASRALKLFDREGMTFDLIFLDPPFQAGLLTDTINAIADLNLLKPHGQLVAEHPRDVRFEGIRLKLFDERNYGDIGLTFFKIDNQ